MGSNGRYRKINQEVISIVQARLDGGLDRSSQQWSWKKIGHNSTLWKH